MAESNLNIEVELLESALSINSRLSPSHQVLSWLEERREMINISIKRKDLLDLRDWNYDENVGQIIHKGGRFFRVEGLEVRTDWGRVPTWQQPIINQPEVGLLGFVTKRIDGILHFYAQAKIEPGNINYVQLSPTVQATKSNYTLAHQGRRPLYLDYFNGEIPCTIILDQLQSEQGSRFLRKRNRNIIVRIEDNDTIPEHPDFMWLTLGQIKSLMRLNNVVNMDTRTVISGINYGNVRHHADYQSAGSHSDKSYITKFIVSGTQLYPYHQTMANILSWITRLKSTYDLYTERAPLMKLQDWEYIDGSISHRMNKYFSVIGVDVHIDSREVVEWDQPMIMPAQEGLIAFIVRPINGVMHFLVQAKLEAGNFDAIELAPTVQCLIGDYKPDTREYEVPYLDRVLYANPNSIIYDNFQSEEGGRFYNEQNRNVIIEVDDSFPTEVDPRYCWISLQQLLTLVQYNNYLNLAARCLLSAISFK